MNCCKQSHDSNACPSWEGEGLATMPCSPQPLLFDTPSFFDEHWEGMPEYKMEDKTSHRKIVVHFRSDEDFASFCNIISQKLGSKQPSTWYPEMPHRKASHMTYENE
jgi:hypothetical protein